MIRPLKPWKSFSKQVELLEKRGMIFHNKQQAEKELERIGYYRLSGYWYPFRQYVPKLPNRTNNKKRSNRFVPNTEFKHIIQLYEFDNLIKLLALEAIQQIEIAMRVQISYILGQKAVNAHINPSYFSTFTDENGRQLTHADWLRKYNSTLNNPKDDFVQHNLTEYGELPIWVACETWDFGTLSRFYQGINLISEKQKMNKAFLLFNDELTSHLKAFNFIRNVSAHHGRLWNRHMVGTPSIKYLSDKNNPEWKSLEKYSDHVFTTFCLMKRMLNVICPQSDWGQRFQTALNIFPVNNAVPHEINLDKMGMGGLSLADLSNWQLWK